MIEQAVPSVIAAAGATARSRDVLLGDDGRDQQVAVTVATSSLFDVAAAPMALGSSSVIDAPESGYGAAVLSYAVWQGMYGGDPTVLGSSLRLATGPATIVGVAQADFALPPDTDVWILPRTKCDVHRERLRRIRPRSQGHGRRRSPGASSPR